MPRGGKEKCTAEVIDRAVRLKKAGALDKDIAASCGVTPSTFSIWINSPKSENQQKLSQAIKKAEADYYAALEAIVLRAAREQTWQAAAWLLERKRPSDYGSPAHRLMIQANKETDNNVDDFLKAWKDA